MTKENLSKNIHALFDSIHGFTMLDIQAYLNEFFSQNICIPKGEKRHPYADVLHKWIEGAEIEARNSDNSYDWYYHGFDNLEYRIKPSEPTYEWQWCLMLKTTKEVTAYMASNNHLTDNEAKEWISKHVNVEHFLPIKIEETRRERK
jgi:hypothetical protein